ncbi:hypothetical protein EVAR_82598_1 [Eumeta japonica]|uniref:Uncharacterized protein n=1 Tax=Eumeta variegata TaxID=151549 RepID=A0A4C1X2N3_EUMVA|nr:hypothetical protein EVAR_82598_1 [Eumeta japonica]
MFALFTGGRATITKLAAEIDTIALEFCKPIINSRLACYSVAKTVRNRSTETEHSSPRFGDLDLTGGKSSGCGLAFGFPELHWGGIIDYTNIFVG